MKKTILISGTLTICCSVGTASAQTVAPNDCAPLEIELRSSQEHVARLERQLAESDQALTVTQSTIDQLRVVSAKLNEAVGAVESCHAERQNLCSASREFARALTEGRVETRELSGCISGDHQHRLVEQLSGWRNVSSTLAQLGSYANGETNRPPLLGASSGTRVEKLLARLLAQGQTGAPLLYRRLLVEAMNLVAPQAWRRIRTGGTARLEGWFASSEPLDAEVLEEAQRGAEVQAQGGALSMALSMVHVYRRLARCHEPQAGARACVRAEQLAQVLESNGPLLLRRRVQDIWSTDCAALDTLAVSRWLREVPGVVDSRSDQPGRTEVIAAAKHKLFACFLRDVGAGESFEAWLSTRLPSAESITARELQRVDELRREGSVDDAAQVRCAAAARVLQAMSAPSSCALPAQAVSVLKDWADRFAQSNVAKASIQLRMCSRFTRALWEGRAVTIPPTFPSTPALDDIVVTVGVAPPTGMARLREHCASRSGKVTIFPKDVLELSQIARAFGEAEGAPPWRVDPGSGRPLEAIRRVRADTVENWLEYLAGRTTSCSALAMDAARCDQCRKLPSDAHYDCTLLQQLQTKWTRAARLSAFGALGVVGLILLLNWLRQLSRTRREFGTWSRETIKSLAALGIPLRPDPLRWLFPSRFQVLTADLPSHPAWERWGKRAVLVLASRGSTVHARDVNRTALAAHEAGAEFALLVHDPAASLDLPAIRAVLECAARGSRAVHVLPVSSERLQWSRGPDDLLDLVEEGSLRQNPFEVRGRIQSSQQFFNRERLVSGLLASVQAGHFTVVTGLRRFGKSSLALEVGRRTPGPCAYVDLAGFYDEFARPGDPARAADSVLRYLCAQLNDAAALRYPSVRAPMPPDVENRLDATSLATWFRDFGLACSTANAGRSVTMLLILDELEQAIAVGADRLEHALSVLAIVIGRLRNALSGASFSQGGTRVGMLVCSAIDPLLWAPLGTLAHQSLMGSFPAVCVPRLPEEAAVAMMRGLGARHGIRFTDPAIEYIVRQAQGIPLLVRRIGSAVLELYDPERARQGGLGAVEIGIEGATTAVEREELDGSPLRVWIESEIASPQSPSGTVLRRLAVSPACSTEELRGLAADHILQRFAETGIDRTLSASECQRRAEEASGLLLRLLDESGLLVAQGDLTSPEGYALPEGVVRRVLALAARRSNPDRPSARSLQLASPG